MCLTLFSQALPEVDAVGALHKVVEDRVGNGWIADHTATVFDGTLLITMVHRLRIGPR